MRDLLRTSKTALAALALLGLGIAFVAPSAHAATISIINADGLNEGFNDPTPVAPVGGNPGVTIGQQRLNVFNQAAAIWGGILQSNVVIVVRAQFNPQSCTATAGTLGSTGNALYFTDTPGTIIPGHWYHSALANKLANSDLNAASQDMNSTFNSSIGGATCLPQGWYYGFDGNEGSQIELLSVVLHEMGHGLGFSTPTSGASGTQLNGQPSVYDHFTYDRTLGLHWDQMSDAQRVSGSTSCTRLVWDGPAVVAGSPARLGPMGLLRVNAPAAIAADYPVGTATFGPPLGYPGVTGDVVLADDGVAATDINDGCEPIMNNVNGKIALINRGTCTFVVKATNAQNAGAIAVIIADNAAGCPPAGLGGTDPTITIPAIRVTQADGNLLKANLVGQNVTLLVDPSRDAGADPQHRVFLYTPSTFSGGSSISHFDVSAEPNLLMEPAINNDLHDDVDLTRHQMSDIGWMDFATPVLVAPGRILAEASRVRVEWYSSEAGSRVWTAYRSTDGVNWQSLGAPRLLGGGVMVIEDENVVAGTRYAYRLGAYMGNVEEYSETVWATVPSNLAFALVGAVPNPATGPLSVAFSLPSAAPARIDLVNVAGRLLFSKEVGDRGPGSHIVPLDLSRKLDAGVYFLQLTQEGRTLKAPVTVVR
jgi:hypothetical protein